jgi:hypothetical protein
MHDQRADAGGELATRDLQDVGSVRWYDLGRHHTVLRTTVMVNNGVGGNAVHPPQGIADHQETLGVPDQPLQNVLHQVVSICRVADPSVHPPG